jgi:AcrR family transcriptional regulator
MNAANSKEALLARVLDYAAADGIADRSLREIAAGAGTSHRMLLYHFGSREGLLAAIVGAMEAQQRASMAAMADPAGPPEEIVRRLWQQVSSAELRPYVRLFFEVFVLAGRGAPGTERLLADLTRPWVEEAVAVAERIGLRPDPAAMRLSVAASRGLLLDLLAGAPRAEVDAAHELLIALLGGNARPRGGGPGVSPYGGKV